MLLKEKIIVGFFMLIIAVTVYNAHYPICLITGEYKAIIESDLNLPETKKDYKLILNKDGTFKCDIWGSGTYKVRGEGIYFTYKENLYVTRFTRDLFFGKPTITDGAYSAKYVKQ